jgi:RNA-directed DNA polymerase
MKSYRHLYDQVCDWDNLYLAYRKARKGKRGRPPAAAFEFDLEANLVGLQRELIAKAYAPGAYSSFYIHEPKRRLISAAPFRDRVVHHALCNVIEPIFERSFILFVADSLSVITPRQYQHVAEMVTEVGRLLGGWRQSLTSA